MSKNHQIPSSVRKIRAKLRNYTRPFVWGSLVMTTIVSLLLWELWRNPESFYLLNLEETAVASGNAEEDGATLSAEDSIIAADIDSSDVLLNDLKEMEPPPATVIPSNIQTTNPKNRPIAQPQKTEKRKPSGDLFSIDRNEDEGQSAGLSLLPEVPVLPSVPNNGMLDASAPGAIATPPGTVNNSGIYGLNGSTFTTPNIGDLPVSALQTAMDRIYSSETPSGDSASSDTENEQSRDSRQKKAQNSTASQRNGESQPNPSNRGSQAAESAYGNQTGSNSNPTSQNSRNPYANQTGSNSNPSYQNSGNPYANQTGSNLNPNSQSSGNAYRNQTGSNSSRNPQRSNKDSEPNGTILNQSNIQQNMLENRAIDPTLPGEILLPGMGYGINYSTNQSPYSTTNPTTGLSNPTNAYEYLLRSQTQTSGSSLLPAAPEAAPMQPLELGQPAYQNPNPNGNPYNAQTPTQSNSGATNLTPNSLQQRSLNAPTSETVTPSGDRSANPSRDRRSSGSSVPATGSDRGMSSGLDPNLQNQGVQPIQPTQPFSVPRPIPGRYIGGGQIDTFSNP